MAKSRGPGLRFSPDEFELNSERSKVKLELPGIYIKMRHRLFEKDFLRLFEDSFLSSCKEANSEGVS